MLCNELCQVYIAQKRTSVKEKKKKTIKTVFMLHGRSVFVVLDNVTNGSCIMEFKKGKSTAC